MPAPGACPVRIAVVTAVLGTRDFVFTPPPQPCSEFFLFTNWTRVENANASRWTVVTPYPAFAARPRDRDGMPVPGPDGRNLRVLFSETWADAIAQIRLGFEAPTLTFQPEGAALYAGEPLPFDLASLGYTTELETEVARFQKLANVMAPRFVKCDNADALAEYCAALARAAPATPFFYYHFPLATGVATKPSQLVRAALARVPTFAGMKYSAADMWEYGECCDADADGRLAFLPGFEAQTLAHLPYHPQDSYGAISLSFSILAPLHRDVADAFYSGQSAEAHALQATSRGFFRAVTPFGWTQAVKLALVDRGVLDSPLCRAPSRNLSPGERGALRRVFRDLAKREPRYFGGLVGD